MARRAAYVESLRTEGIPLLLLDAGNFFARPDRTTDIISVVAWKEMERLRHDAVILGRREFERWFLVEYLLAESPLPLVTTNVEVKRDGTWEPLGISDLVVERGGLRVGILGLTEKSDLPGWVLHSRADNLRVLPVVSSATRACARLKNRVDLVVALVASNSDVFSGLPSEVPGIDIVVAGRGACSVGGEVLNESSTRGWSLGIARLVVAPCGQLLSSRGHNVDLTPAHAEDSVIAGDADRVMEESRSMYEEVRQAQRQPGYRHWVKQPGE